MTNTLTTTFISSSSKLLPHLYTCNPQEAKGFLNFNKEDETVSNKDDEFYVTPPDRACGRPSNLGWLDLLGDEEITGVKEDANEAFDSDNWREVIVNKQR